MPHNEVTDLDERGPWWVLANDALGEAVATRLQELGADVVVLHPGTEYTRDNRTITVTPDAQCDYTRAIQEFGRPGTVLHAWSLGAPNDFDAAQDLGFHPARALTGALAAAQEAGAVEFIFCTRGAVAVVGGDLTHPEQGTLHGLGPVIGQEVPNITCRFIDIDLSGNIDVQEIVAEACTGARDQVAYRRTDRWVQTYEQIRVEPRTRRPIAEGGTVLITGGLGDVGVVLGEHLASTRNCNLVLTVRTPLPPEEEWADYPDGDRAARHIRTIQRLRAQGVDVLALAADVSDRDQMADVVAKARQRFGRIDAVIHGAGISGAQYFGLTAEMTRDQVAAHFTAKIAGLRVLHDVLGDTDAPLRVTVSSLSSMLGGLGFAAYAASNSGMDSYARALGWLTVNWEGWGLRGEEDHPMPATTIMEYWMQQDEGVEIFERSLTLAGRVSQLVTSSGPLKPRLAQWTDVRGQENVAQQRHARPQLSTQYEPPTPGDEAAIAELWCEVLGIAEIGVHDNFFELGGHSLTAVRLMGRIRVTYGGVPISAVIEHPTIRELTKVLSALC